MSQDEGTDTPAAAGKGRRIVVAGAVLVAAAGLVAGALWLLQGEPAPPALAVADAGAAVPDAGAFTAMSLEEGDALLKKLAGEWSKDSALVTLLGRPGIIAILVAAVNLLAEGESPRPVLSFLGFSGKYEVLEERPAPAKKKGRQARVKGNRRKAAKVDVPPVPIFVSPAAYTRYDALTRTFTSVDPAAAGKGYAALRPYLETAYRTIGRPGTTFDDVLVTAIKRLLAVKFPEGKIELTTRGAVFLYKDPALESLGQAEKQMLRMGPENGRAVQGQLKAFAESAGFKVTP